jgi:hypothetical protein
MIPETLCREEAAWLGRGERLWSNSGWRSCGSGTTSTGSAMDTFVVLRYPHCDEVIPPVDENSPPAGR